MQPFTASLVKYKCPLGGDFDEQGDEKNKGDDRGRNNTKGAKMLNH